MQTTGSNAALVEKRAAVLERWFQAILATYPEETAQFLRQNKNQFANPVGSTIVTRIGVLYDALIAGEPVSALAPALDDIVRIRAVQDFAPSAAVAFVYALKPILREELAGADLAPAAWAHLDAGVDRMALLAFDIYVQCRERLFEIRVREIKEHQHIAARGGGCAPAQCVSTQSTTKEGR